jgi:hypothetical protein
MQSAPKLAGLSGNEIYCTRLKDAWVNGAGG